MSPIKTRMVEWLGGDRSRVEAVRARVRTSPVCESLEGRQLLNGAWAWPDPAGAAGAVPVQLHHGGMPGGAGKHAMTPPALSAAAQAAFKTLQADETALQNEIKADANITSLSDALKADEAVFQKALASTTKGATHPLDRFGGDRVGGPGFRGPGFGGPGFGGPKANATLPAALVTKLTAAGVTTDQITKFETDAKALQTAIEAVDPTLQTRIQTERQALQKDLPAHPAPPMTGHAHFDHIKATTTTTTPSTTG